MLDFAHEDRLFPRATVSTVRRGLAVIPTSPAASRADRLAQIKADIANGTYLTDEKLDAALEKMLSTQCR